MSSFLDTVQPLQFANENFRKQLMDAGIELGPMPAAWFNSQQLLVGKSLDRTSLKENELIKEKPLIINQKISHLSSELNNVIITISQTINYVQSLHLTHMLDAAEHVTPQEQIRAMSNGFLSDMLSLGVKKTGPLQPKNTCTIATQTPPAVWTLLQLQQQQLFQQQVLRQFNSSEGRHSRSFTFSSSLFNITGKNDGNGVRYKSRGSASNIERGS